MVTSQAGEVDPVAEAARLKAIEDEKIKDPAAVLAKNKELLALLAAEKAEKEQLKKDKEEGEKKAKEDEQARLIAANDYKALYEKSEKEKAENEKKLKEKDEVLAKGAKLAGVQNELSKLGINPDRLAFAMRSVDLNGVKYDEALKILTGADAEAARLKMLSPEWFGARDMEQMDDGENGSNGRPGKITLESYLKLSKEKQKELYPQMIKDTTGMVVTPKKRF
jgi:hypothetical protein